MEATVSTLVVNSTSTNHQDLGQDHLSNECDAIEMLKPFLLCAFS